MTDREFRALYETTAESRLWRAGAGAVRMWSAAWRDSAAVRAIGGVRSSIGGWSARDRLRYGALAVAIAAFGHLVLASLLPAYVAPALPRGLILTVAAIAAAIAIAPQLFATAWSESRLRRAGASAESSSGRDL